VEPRAAPASNRSAPDLAAEHRRQVFAPENFNEIVQSWSAQQALEHDLETGNVAE